VAGLFCGFDALSSPSLELSLSGIDLAAITSQEPEPAHAEFRTLLDEPIRPIALGRRDCNKERITSRRIDFVTVRNVYLERSALGTGDSTGHFATPAVKQDDLTADLEPQDAQRVIGFVAADANPLP
jgi:hypothetical protein